MPFRASGLRQGTTVCGRKEGEVRDSVFLESYASSATLQEESHCDRYPESRETGVKDAGQVDLKPVPGGKCTAREQHHCSKGLSPAAKVGARNADVPASHAPVTIEEPSGATRLRTARMVTKTTTFSGLSGRTRLLKRRIVGAL